MELKLSLTGSGGILFLVGIIAGILGYRIVTRARAVVAANQWLERLEMVDD